MAVGTADAKGVATHRSLPKGVVTCATVTPVKVVIVPGTTTLTRILLHHLWMDGLCRLMSVGSIRDVDAVVAEAVVWPRLWNKHDGPIHLGDYCLTICGSPKKYVGIQL